LRASLAAADTATRPEVPRPFEEVGYEESRDVDPGSQSAGLRSVVEIGDAIDA
jgi:hypothetical protein